MVFHCLFIRVSGSGFTGELWFFYLAFGLFFVSMLSRLVLLLYLQFVSVNGTIILWWMLVLRVSGLPSWQCAVRWSATWYFSGARLCAQVIHLFPAIVPCLLFELCLTILGPSVVRVSLRFGELWTRFTFRYGSPL